MTVQYVCDNCGAVCDDSLNSFEKKITVKDVDGRLSVSFNGPLSVHLCKNCLIKAAAVFYTAIAPL